MHIWSCGNCVSELHEAFGVEVCNTKSLNLRMYVRTNTSTHLSDEAEMKQSYG
jgi:hypothetical protein